MGIQQQSRFVSACILLGVGMGAAAACGGSDDNEPPEGMGGDGATTGGNGGSDTGSGGTGSQTTGGMSGTGGTAPDAPIPVPGTDDYNCSPKSGTPGTLGVEVVSSGFTDLTLVTHAPGDTRLFAVEQRGIITVIDGANKSTFLDIDSLIVDKAGYDERGLLGLAFHPDYQENGLFYVHYSADATATGLSEGETVIAEYKVSDDDADKADPTERILFHLYQPFGNHNGGTIAFGSDGYLYIGLGDGGDQNDPDNNGQTPSTLLGNILRIDPTDQSNGEYGTPEGNLKDVMPGAAPEVWDYGFRNPYRFNFDACTGDLYIGDVGQNTWEEIDVEKRGDGNKNYGWNVAEGKHCRGSDGTNDTCDRTGMIDPVWDYSHDDGGVSVTGGTVYRGSDIPWLRGTYFFGDYGNASVFSFSFDRESETITDVVNHSNEFTVNSVSSIQNGPGGEIYLTTLGGTIYKLVAAD